MVDVLTVTQRSYNMSRIRSAGTVPEQNFLLLLEANGIRDFITHPDWIPGKPDVYFPISKLAIFVDGCFWHACDQCFQMPATNKEFWSKKIGANVIHDKKVNALLKSMGILTIRIWEHDLKNSPDKFIFDIKEKIAATSTPTVLDLFAGAGGFSEGFIGSGCDMVGHIEMDDSACKTLITRMVYHALLKLGKVDEYRHYILGKTTLEALIEKYSLQKERDSVICAKIGKDNFKDLIKKIKQKLGSKNLDIIVGGPPCQAYSHIGRARDEKSMRWDHRKFLYRYYIEFLKALKPKIFVFENVPGLLSSGKGRYLREMRNLMKKAGYKTDFRIVDATDYGVPQHRKRVLLVGWNKYSKLEKYPNFQAVKREYVVKNFLDALPKIKAGGGKPIIKNFSKRNELLEKVGMTSFHFPILMDHVARPHNARDLEIYRRVVNAKKKGIRLKYNALPKRLKTHKNEECFLDRFKVIDAEARGSHTVVAHLQKDGHSYIHPDLAQNRSVTVREAARLQSFPDDYKFEGSRGSQFCQIGNAVPPMLSKVVAHELIKYL
ncbi:MAG: DNA (cytosine-5-)-methyltransferase [Candidatus Peregrinibacteria bacterium Greene0416_19]|nr:MAG: DNA (cytosine-5-)-methyltransferase [Candidatus Peregrinibacteria bacterium Greene0416_19]